MEALLEAISAGLIPYALLLGSATVGAVVIMFTLRAVKLI